MSQLPTPTERLATILRWLITAVDGPSMFGPFPRPLAMLIMDRIRTFKQRFARVAAGTYVPRRPAAAPRRRPAPHARRPNPLPHGLGWLPKLLPDTRVYAAHLIHLLDDPEMAALVAAAPSAMRRPLRSLCRMLGVPPPPLLAIPKPPPVPKAAPKPPPPKSGPPPQPPAWMPRRTRWTLTRIRGSPKPA